MYLYNSANIQSVRCNDKRDKANTHFSMCITDWSDPFLHALLKYTKERAMAIRIYNSTRPVLFYRIKESILVPFTGIVSDQSHTREHRPYYLIYILRADLIHICPILNYLRSMHSGPSVPVHAPPAIRTSESRIHWSVDPVHAYFDTLLWSGQG